MVAFEFPARTFPANIFAENKNNNKVSWRQQKRRYKHALQKIEKFKTTRRNWTQNPVSIVSIVPDKCLVDHLSEKTQRKTTKISQNYHYALPKMLLHYFLTTWRPEIYSVFIGCSSSTSSTQVNESVVSVDRQNFFVHFITLANLLCKFPLTMFSKISQKNFKNKISKKKFQKKFLKKNLIIFREFFFQIFWAITVPHPIWSMPAKILGGPGTLVWEEI
jgi:hypothetical protein